MASLFSQYGQERVFAEKPRDATNYTEGNNSQYAMG